MDDDGCSQSRLLMASPTGYEETLTTDQPPTATTPHPLLSKLLYGICVQIIVVHREIYIWIVCFIPQHFFLFLYTLSYLPFKCTQSSFNRMTQYLNFYQKFSQL